MESGGNIQDERLEKQEMKNEYTKLRILYLSFNNPYLTLGVYKKEIEFCKAMYEICHESAIQFKGINIFVSEHVDESVWHKQTLDYFKLRKLDNRLPKVFSRIRTITALSRIQPIFQAAYREINGFRPSVIIFRYNMLEIPAPFNPKKVKRNVLFISEHNTKELEELSNVFHHKTLPVAFERIKARWFFRNVDAVIGVTSEIAKYQVKRANRILPYLVLSNGVDVNKHAMTRYSAFRGNELKMIFVSSFISVWHGVDRLLKGIKAYEGNVRLEINIVGSVGQNIKDLVKSLDLEQKVVFHGAKFGKELDEVFDNMHIAIGTLGLHRQKLKYASTLKVREYMARGIPFVISHIDEDIVEDFPLALRLRSDDSPVDMEKIIKFTERVYEKYGVAIPSIMRDYALEKMDYKVKVKRLLSFILQQTI